MKSQTWPMYVAALAILTVGLVWAGVPASAVLLATPLLVCPLVMMVMTRGRPGGATTSRDAHHDEQHDDAEHTDDRQGAGHGSVR